MQKDADNSRDIADFGRALQGLLRRTELTQEDLATLINVNPITIQRWMANVSRPRLEILEKLIEELLHHNAFTKGKEQEEVEAFLKQSGLDATFDTARFKRLLGVNESYTTEIPTTLFYCYADEDKPFRDRLEKHLSVLKRQSFIVGWYDRRIVPGTDWARSIDSHLMTASIILLLVSPNFLASDYVYSIEMRHALERHDAGYARVIPIILRPVDWKEAPFAHLPILPRNAMPVTKWSNRDDAFLDISRGIRLICEDLQISRVTQRSPAEEASISLSDHSLRFYRLYEVFVKSGVPKITFVEREDFELLKLSLAQPGRGVVIEGPSGIGKTTAVEKAVETLLSHQRKQGIGEAVQILSARNPEHRDKLETLYKWHTGTVIIDDFHRLTPRLREALIDYLKYLADAEPLSKKLVIVGIPQTGQTLVDISFDVATRIDVFRMGLVNDELVLHMIEKGEKALNIQFDRKIEIALAAGGSLNIAQFLCFNTCHQERLTETQTKLRVIHSDTDVAVSSVMADLSRKFGESIRHFAAMGEPRDSTALLLLEELASSENGFLSLPMLKSRKPNLVSGIERFLDEGWIDRLYSEYPISANHLFFDQGSQSLVIDDPQLAFYLKKLRFSTLSREVGKSASLAQRKIFISYSHKDTRWLDRLRVHLAPLEREGIIDLWDDTKIAAGVQWKSTILEALETARVAIVLVSADYLASEFIQKLELPKILSRAELEGTAIFFVIVSPCAIDYTDLSVFQTINSPNQPLSSMRAIDREMVWAKVAESIRKSLATEES